MKPDSSRHRRKCEPQLLPPLMVCFRPSLTLVVSLQTQSKRTCQKNHKNLICPVPCSQGPHCCSMPDAGIRTSVLVRKGNLHFLCNRNLCTSPGSCWQKQRTVLHGGVPDTGKQRGDSPEAAGGLALLGLPKRLPTPLQQTWGWWAAVASAPEMLFSAVCSGWHFAALGLERQPSSRAVPSASQKGCEWAQNAVF